MRIFEIIVKIRVESAHLDLSSARGFGRRRFTRSNESKE
jgi:hypothetical protein